jgi:hypothetical protein
MNRRFYPPSESDIPLHGWRPYSDMHRERIRAHAKHDERGGSMERKHFEDPAWLPVLVEEMGEVARVLCDARLGVLDGNLAAKLREELMQLGAMTAAWVDAIDAEPFTGVIPPPAGSPIVITGDPGPTPAGLTAAVVDEIRQMDKAARNRLGMA